MFTDDPKSSQISQSTLHPELPLPLPLPLPLLLPLQAQLISKFEQAMDGTTFADAEHEYHAQ